MNIFWNNELQKLVPRVRLTASLVTKESRSQKISIQNNLSYNPIKFPLTLAKSFC